MTCHRCGTPGHLVTVCKFSDTICHKCKKRDTWQECVGVRVRPNPRPLPQGVDQRDPSLLHNQFGKLTSRNPSEDSLAILTVERKNRLPPIQLEQDKVELEPDPLHFKSGVARSFGEVWGNIPGRPRDLQRL